MKVDKDANRNSKTDMWYTERREAGKGVANETNSETRNKGIIIDTRWVELGGPAPQAQRLGTDDPTRPKYHQQPLHHVSSFCSQVWHNEGASSGGPLCLKRGHVDPLPPHPRASVSRRVAGPVVERVHMLPRLPEELPAPQGRSRHHHFRGVVRSRTASNV